MSARPCRWCNASLQLCIVTHVHTGHPCCDDCRRTEPTAHTKETPDE